MATETEDFQAVLDIVSDALMRLKTPLSEQIVDALKPDQFQKVLKSVQSIGKTKTTSVKTTIGGNVFKTLPGSVADIATAFKGWNKKLEDYIVAHPSTTRETIFLNLGSGRVLSQETMKKPGSKTYGTHTLTYERQVYNFTDGGKEPGLKTSEEFKHFLSMLNSDYVEVIDDEEVEDIEDVILDVATKYLESFSSISAKVLKEKVIEKNPKLKATVIGQKITLMLNSKKLVGTNAKITLPVESEDEDAEAEASDAEVDE
jgi:hypothetical protein